MEHNIWLNDMHFGVSHQLASWSRHTLWQTGLARLACHISVYIAVVFFPMPTCTLITPMHMARLNY
jgi:hypothetical protein